MSEPPRKSSARHPCFFSVLAKVWLDEFVHTFVRILRSSSHNLYPCRGDFKRTGSSHVSTSGNVQAIDPQRPSVEPSLRTPEQHRLAEHDDERTLSICANGAYYLYVLGCARSMQLFSVSIHARGGVDVPSPEKHR